MKVYGSCALDVCLAVLVSFASAQNQRWSESKTVINKREARDSRHLWALSESVNNGFSSSRGAKQIFKPSSCCRHVQAPLVIFQERAALADSTATAPLPQNALIWNVFFPFNSAPGSCIRLSGLDEAVRGHISVIPHGSPEKKRFLCDNLMPPLFPYLLKGRQDAERAALSLSGRIAFDLLCCSSSSSWVLC